MSSPIVLVHSPCFLSDNRLICVGSNVQLRGYRKWHFTGTVGLIVIYPIGYTLKIIQVSRA